MTKTTFEARRGRGCGIAGLAVARAGSLKVELVTTTPTSGTARSFHFNKHYPDIRLLAPSAPKVQRRVQRRLAGTAGDIIACRLTRRSISITSTR